MVPIGYKTIAGTTAVEQEPRVFLAVANKGGCNTNN